MLGIRCWGTPAVAQFLEEGEDALSVGFLYFVHVSIGIPIDHVPRWGFVL